MLVGRPLSKQLEIDDWARKNGVHFIAAETRGLFGYPQIQPVAIGRLIFVPDPSSMTLDPNLRVSIPRGSKLFRA